MAGVAPLTVRPGSPGFGVGTAVVGGEGAAVVDVVVGAAVVVGAGVVVVEGVDVVDVAPASPNAGGAARLRVSIETPASVVVLAMTRDHMRQPPTGRGGGVELTRTARGCNRPSEDRPGR